MEDFYKSQIGKYFAVRTYSHTDKRGMLWKVLTRPVSDLVSAVVSAEVEAKRCPKDQETFVVRVVSENDAERDLCLARGEGWHEGYQECLRRIQSGEIKV